MGRRINALLWPIYIGILPTISYANDNSYEPVLKHYEAKDDSVILKSEEGEIVGEHHLAVISRHEEGLLLTVFRRKSTRYVGVAQTKYMSDLPNVSTVTIARNSIFLETGYCHHGCYDYRYQFKNVGQRFLLVGYESQNSTLCGYYDEQNAPPGCNHSVESGTSYNLLSSTLICWADIENVTPAKLPQPYQPRGIQHKMSLQKINLPLLEGFDLEKFSPPKSCYFDYKKRLYVN